MKRLFPIILLVAGALTSCNREELLEQNGLQVIKAVMENESTDVKSSVDEDGTFSWTEGDKIKLYTDSAPAVAQIKSVNEDGSGWFVYTLPDGVTFSGAAVYPSELNYKANGQITLPSEYDLGSDSDNVNAPMLGHLAGDEIVFEHLAGVVALDIRNVPAEVRSVELTLGGAKLNGSFLIKDGCIKTAETDKAAEQTTVLKFALADTTSHDLKLYVPVPVGTYESTTVVFKNAEGAAVKTIEGKSSNVINRKSMLKMPAIVFDNIGLKAAVKDVKPFFSNAKVTWTPVQSEHVSGYAIYVDDEEPVIINDKAIGEYSIGNASFDVDSEHTVSIAYLAADGSVVPLSKSEPVTFKTAKIYQVRNNVGPTSVCVGWDDVSGYSGANNRVFHIELYASQDTEAEPIYSIYTWDGQLTCSGAFQSSSWYGKVGGSNIYSEPRVIFGHLEPATTYYFRVKTIKTYASKDLGIHFCTDKESVNISSKAGESEYSKLFALTTEDAHVPASKEVLYQGFDQLMLNADLVNHAAAIGPLVKHVGSKASTRDNMWKYYKYPWDGEFTPFVPNTAPTFAQYGLVDAQGNMNANAGDDLAGWVAIENTVYPKAGYIRIGNSQSDFIPGIMTPALEANLTDEEQICDVTFDACPTGTDVLPARLGRYLRVDYLVPLADGSYRVVEGNEVELKEPRAFTDQKNYIWDYKWERCKVQVKLAKGYKIRIVKNHGASNTARICVDNIHVTVADDQTNYTGAVDRYNAGVSEITNTDYDVFDLDGKFPISYWYSIPHAFRSFERYQELVDCGFNIINYSTSGEDIRDVASNRMVIDWAKQLGVKFFASLGFNDADPDSILPYIPEIVNGYEDEFVGYHFADEPNTSRYAALAEGAKAFEAMYPGKVSYINLFPSYARIGDQLYADSYEAYVDEYLRLFTPNSISFDAYPINSDKTMRADYYYNLDLIRYKALERKIPFWYIGHGGGINVSAQELNEQEFRWNAWSSFAYGSKGYQYFCYWTPVVEANVNITPGFMIDLNGNRTKYYYYAQELNKDMVPFGEKLLPCHPDGVIQASSFQYSVYDARYTYGPLKSADGENAIVGCFRNATTGAYLLLVTGQRTEFVCKTVPAVELNFDETVKSVSLMYTEDASVTSKTITDGKLSLTIPHGEAYLVELVLE